MKKFLSITLLALAFGMMSCSLDDDELFDVEQTNKMATDSPNDPPVEETGEEEELDPNN